MWRFATEECGQCGANLARRKPREPVIEVKPHPGEEGIVKEWNYAPCPVCGIGVTVIGESEPPEVVTESAELTESEPPADEPPVTEPPAKESEVEPKE